MLVIRSNGIGALSSAIFLVISSPAYLSVLSVRPTI